MTKPIVNMAASVRERLLNLARERKEDFGLVLTKYGLERVLYRISRSKHREEFVLKGALLFELWTEQRYRPTRDADFLALGQNRPERFVEIFRETCEIKVEDDGLRFDAATITAERITEDADYEGIRVRFVGYLENARIPIQIDLGFGDVITPAPVETELSSLLDGPKAKLLTYPRESVVAEKFEAMVSLGLANSRMKDFHDVRSLGHDFAFEGGSLSDAIKKTLARRETALPAGIPLVFTAEFFNDADKKKQWAAFCNKNRNYVPEISLEQVCGEISSFLLPLVNGLNGKGPVPKKWERGAWSK
ncbi:MAG: nucleotidyl transferase AbiEii/AbiGii toxin family protein [Acidobacteriia bacterium]|nr:nucleotidyl transferase AbiEii/AbiGii toxin family protein [Terriglobia bacterium]